MANNSEPKKSYLNIFVHFHKLNDSTTNLFIVKNQYFTAATIGTKRSIIFRREVVFTPSPPLFHPEMTDPAESVIDVQMSRILSIFTRDRVS